MILFAWRRQPPPGFVGGAEITEGLVAAALAGAGESVTFVGCTDNPRDPSVSARDWLLELLGRQGIPVPLAADHFEYTWRGVRCIVVPQEALIPIVGSLSHEASVVWSSQERCNETLSAVHGCAKVSYVHSVSEVGLLSARAGADWVFAPSEFVQRRVLNVAAKPTFLLRPSLDPPRSREVVERSGVLFVNPIPEKGLSTALAVARALPDVRFWFVESWRPASDRSSFPSNVKLLPRLPSLEVLYARAALLIVPSLIEDACPRVVLEAGAAALPAIGSRRGGIPELIGRTDDLLDPNDVRAWAERCRDLLDDPVEWLESSAAQTRRASELTVDPVQIIYDAGVPIRMGTWER